MGATAARHPGGPRETAQSQLPHLLLGCTLDDCTLRWLGDVECRPSTILSSCLHALPEAARVVCQFEVEGYDCAHEHIQTVLEQGATRPETTEAKKADNGRSEESSKESRLRLVGDGR